MPKLCWLKVPAVYFNMGKAFWSSVLRSMTFLAADIWTKFLKVYFYKKTCITIYLVPPQHPPYREVKSDFVWAPIMIDCCYPVFWQTGSSSIFSDIVFQSGAVGSPADLTHLLGVSWDATALDLPRASSCQWSLFIRYMTFHAPDLMGISL